MDLEEITLILDILLRQSGLAQFYRHFCSKTLILVNPTVPEIFNRHFCSKALILVNPTVLEIFYRHFCAKALVLVNPTVL